MAEFEKDEQKAKNAICFIKATQELLDTEGIEKLSIRKIAEKAGFHNSTIYLYFKDIQHLILLASLKHFTEYNHSLAEYSQRKCSPEETFFAIWEAFGKTVLQNPTIFYNFFFGKYSQNLTPIILQYYELFPEEKEEYINIIENNNTLLLQLVGDILDLSKIESGTLEFVYSDIDLNALFQELEESARLRQKNDAVVIRYLPEMPDCFVNIEKNRLTQVVTNMMNNAMKFTPSGSITFGYHLKNTDFLYFYITDTGYGIEKDKKDTVFGRFVKLDSFSQGTGLGLSICQSIVENLGGEIGVESEPGKGSTFWFTLPYRPVELKSVREQKEHRLNKVESKLTVLIAEDNESNFLLFESILKRQYNILHAWDGEEAVELFKQYTPHLILMDINMPKKTGYEATQLIREMSPTVPIMAVTAYVYAEDEERILNSGFDAYTSKPINAQKLQSDIVDLLKKQLIFM